MICNTFLDDPVCKFMFKPGWVENVLVKYLEPEFY